MLFGIQAHAPYGVLADKRCYLEAEGSNEGKGLCVAHVSRTNLDSTSFNGKRNPGATWVPSRRLRKSGDNGAYHVELLIRTEILEEPYGYTWHQGSGGI